MLCTGRALAGGLRRHAGAAPHVERARIEAFRARLDLIFEAAPRLRYAPEADLEFVPYARDYTLAHNSNRVIAEWLTELGCEVRGWPLWAWWRIIPPPESVAQASRSAPATGR